MKKRNNFIIIDDDKTSQLICELNIKQYNPQAKTQSFSDPIAALREIEKSGIVDGSGIENETTLFLDINLTNMTGWDFLDLFNNFNQKIKNQFTIFLLTAALENYEKKLEKYPYIKGKFNKPLDLNYLEEIGEFKI